MKELNLNRQNHMEPDFRILNDMRNNLEELIHTEMETYSSDWYEIICAIIRFQNEDGGFNLLDSYQIESDCRVEFCHEPTYICTALLIRTLLWKKELFTGKENVILSRALYMCCARGLQGHGFDGLKDYIKAVNYFVSCDVNAFLIKYPNMCEEFTEMFRNIKRDFAERVENKDFYGAWGDDYEVEIRKIHEYFNNIPVFVYGTLLKGENNHNAYLKESVFVGEGNIVGYEMYDLGYYPGIVSGKGNVLGEVYYVTEETLSRIDILEGEGSLYIKTWVRVRMKNGKRVAAWVYVYNHCVDGCSKIDGRYGHDEMVWYVSYGSNMLEERLKYYITGGICSFNGMSYSACNDRTLPCESRKVEIPFDMFYSNYGMHTQYLGKLRIWYIQKIPYHMMKKIVQNLLLLRKVIVNQ